MSKTSERMQKAAEDLKNGAESAGLDLAMSASTAGGNGAAIEADGVSGHVTQRPHDHPYVPPDGAFEDDDDFLAAPEIAKIGRALIERYEEFTFLRDEVAIEYRWKRKGGKSKGRDVYGTCTKTGGALKHFAACDFFIWIAADHVRESGFDNLQLEALVYHELRHCGYEIDENVNSPTYGEMKLRVRGHDDEVFLEELHRYGAWNSSRRRARDAYAQIALPAA